MRIKDVIEEIKNYKGVSIHKSALDIFKLLENNKALFVEEMSVDSFNHLFNKFENMTYTSPKDYNTSSYEREFKTNYDLLLFYLDRIN